MKSFTLLLLILNLVPAVLFSGPSDARDRPITPSKHYEGDQAILRLYKMFLKKGPTGASMTIKNPWSEKESCQLNIYQAIGRDFLLHCTYENIQFEEPQSPKYCKAKIDLTARAPSIISGEIGFSISLEEFRKFESGLTSESAGRLICNEGSD